MTGTPLHQRVVPETYAQLLHDYLEARDLRAEEVLGSPWPTTVADSSFLEIDVFEGLLNKAARHLCDPLLGLHLGQTVTAQHLGIVGAIILASDNVIAALDRFRRYQRLIFDATPITLAAGDGWMEMNWDISDYEPGQQVELTGNTALVSFLRSLIRGNINPLRIKFSHPPAGPADEYERYFGCSVQFNQADPGIRFDPTLLNRPLKTPDPGLIQLLERHADERLAALPEQAEIVEQVRKAIAYSLRNGEPSIEKISKELACSSRTLQRRLGQADTSFRREVNTIRHEFAVMYLKDPHLQIVDISLLLGYSEHSAFTRAFKEFCGKTPQQVRDEIVEVTNSSRA